MILGALVNFWAHKIDLSPHVLHNWRASVASETLTGATQLKIGDVFWRASEASETVLGVDNAKSGICYMYICMWDNTYAL